MTTQARLKHPEIPLETIRAYVAERANSTSLRNLAPVIGLGHSTLHNFLAGAEPFPPVRNKLSTWYLREQGGDYAVLAAMDTLVQRLPEHGQEGARARLRATLSQCFVEMGLAIPEWVTR